MGAGESFVQRPAWPTAHHSSHVPPSRAGVSICFPGSWLLFTCNQEPSGSHKEALSGAEVVLSPALDQLDPGPVSSACVVRLDPVSTFSSGYLMSGAALVRGHRVDKLHFVQSFQD